MLGDVTLLESLGIAFTIFVVIPVGVILIKDCIKSILEENDRFDE